MCLAINYLANVANQFFFVCVCIFRYFSFLEKNRNMRSNVEGSRFFSYLLLCVFYPQFIIVPLFTMGHVHFFSSVPATNVDRDV